MFTLLFSSVSVLRLSVVASLIDVFAEAELGGDLIVQSEIKLENCFSVLEIKLQRWERCHNAAGADQPVRPVQEVKRL